MKTTNSKCRDLVQQKQSFKANNLHAEYWKALYVVYSYGHYPIFIFDHKAKTWYQNENGYSQSTKKQISQSHPLSTTILNTSCEMKELLCT